MHLTLLLLAAGTLPAQPATTGKPLANLDFQAATLAGWEGDGFRRTAPGEVTSAADEGAKGILHRTFYVPPDATSIRFRAAAYRPADAKPAGALDVVLEGT